MLDQDALLKEGAQALKCFGEGRGPTYCFWSDPVQVDVEAAERLLWVNQQTLCCDRAVRSGQGQADLADAAVLGIGGFDIHGDETQRCTLRCCGLGRAERGCHG